MTHRTTTISASFAKRAATAFGRRFTSASYGCDSTPTGWRSGEQSGTGRVVDALRGCWHPYWKARVNGKAVPVYRANMAYKAIPIERGENLIELQFGSRLFSVLSAIVSVNAAFWLGVVGTGKLWNSGTQALPPLQR
jgi:hypothetical protein